MDCVITYGSSYQFCRRRNQGFNPVYKKYAGVTPKQYKEHTV
ncbi:hypothetical protein [Paenibacillus sp. LjRoot56]